MINGCGLKLGNSWSSVTQQQEVNPAALWECLERRSTCLPTLVDVLLYLGRWRMGIHRPKTNSSSGSSYCCLCSLTHSTNYFILSPLSAALPKPAHLSDLPFCPLSSWACTLQWKPLCSSSVLYALRTPHGFNLSNSKYKYRTFFFLQIMCSAFYFKIGWQTTKTNIWTITSVE